MNFDDALARVLMWANVLPDVARSENDTATALRVARLIVSSGPDKEAGWIGSSMKYIRRAKREARIGDQSPAPLPQVYAIDIKAAAIVIGQIEELAGTDMTTAAALVLDRGRKHRAPKHSGVELDERVTLYAAALSIRNDRDVAYKAAARMIIEKFEAVLDVRDRTILRLLGNGASTSMAAEKVGLKPTMIRKRRDSAIRSVFGTPKTATAHHEKTL